MISRAYFFVNKKLDRYENYSSTLSEFFTRDEIYQLDEEAHKNIKDAAFIVDQHFEYEYEYLFVIYNPNQSKMDLSQYGDFNILKMLVDTQDKANELERYCDTLKELSTLAVLSTNISEYDIKSLIQNKSYNYDHAVDKCNNAIQEYINSMIDLIDLCLADFKKEFVF